MKWMKEDERDEMGWNNEINRTKGNNDKKDEIKRKKYISKRRWKGDKRKILNQTWIPAKNKAAPKGKNKRNQ